MPYAALATDYDGTIARDGAVDGPTLAALAVGGAVAAGGVMWASRRRRILGA